jgi:hypothetical protein
MGRFASLPLGCAVEHALIDRLVSPVREALRTANQLLPDPEEQDWIGQQLHGHLTTNRALMLAAAVGAYNRALGQLTGRPYPWAGYHLLGAQISQAAAPAELRLDDQGIRDRRIKALNRLVDLRNRAAHPGHERGRDLPTEDEIKAAWRAIVTDPGDAFFRYFPTAFPAAGVNERSG